MRGLSLLFITLCFASCRDKAPETPASQTESEPQISYSREVRPFIIANCLSCHADFPLHDPSGWNLLHAHDGSEKIEHPNFLQKWVEQGSQPDPHWAGLPLQRVEGTSVDDFIDQSHPLLTSPRQSPGPAFTAPVAELLAGDLMEAPDKAISTGYLRQGDDSPAWRSEKVAREFLGVNISCAKCHDHPTEHWSTARYQHLQNIFTTPYDNFPEAKPPLYVQQTTEQIAKRTQLQTAIKEATIPPPIPEKAFQEWLTKVGYSPQIPGLVAAYSFDDRELRNLAPTDGIEENGSRLIAENGAHGLAVYFDGNNALSLEGVPTGTERDRFTFSAWIQLEPEALEDTDILTIGKKTRGFRLRIVKGKLQARWDRVGPQLSAVSTSNSSLFAPKRWTHVAVTYDGTRRAAGLKLYLNGHLLETESAPTELITAVLSEGEPWQFSGKGLTLDEVQIYTTELTPLGVRHLFDGRSLATAETKLLRPFFQRHFDPAVQDRHQKISDLVIELLKLEQEFKIYLVMADGQDRPLSTDPKAPRNRHDFAQRLNQNLLARTLANHVWKRHFQTPLAHSLGFSDALPSHPKLLEWLAGQLQQNNLNVAKLGELIRASETWKREWPSLEHDPASCPVDPDITR